MGKYILIGLFILGICLIVYFCLKHSDTNNDSFDNYDEKR